VGFNEFDPAGFVGREMVGRIRLRSQEKLRDFLEPGIVGLFAHAGILERRAPRERNKKEREPIGSTPAL
jgi:hypothetical protein